VFRLIASMCDNFQSLVLPDRATKQVCTVQIHSTNVFTNTTVGRNLLIEKNALHKILCFFPFNKRNPAFEFNCARNKIDDFFIHFYP